MTDSLILQDDVYRDLMSDILEGGLLYGYHKMTDGNGQDYHTRTVSNGKKRHIIVVGAGMSGLVAGYELAQVGHKVTILEATSRVGGKVKTIREGFSDGLTAEGAMRLPFCHYLVRHYIDLFNIRTATFQTTNPEAFVYMRGEKVKMRDWKEHNGYYCTRWWPGWDRNLTEETKKRLNINGILDYFSETMSAMRHEFSKQPKQAEWLQWARRYCHLSTEEFLRNDDGRKEQENKLRPWPEEAITAYKAYDCFSTVTALDYKRAYLGGFWKDPLYSLLDGFDTLPNEFTKPNMRGWNKDVNLADNIVFDFEVNAISETNDCITICGLNKTTNKHDSFTGDAAIFTVAPNILRSMKFTGKHCLERQEALVNISSYSSAKIILQCRTKFWQEDIGVDGGCSRTDLPIGQLFYLPLQNKGSQDKTDKGLLMVYAWDEDAMSFNELSEDAAIQKALSQISFIHPEILEHFEFGKVVPLHNGDHSKGLFNFVDSKNYLETMETLMTPTPRLYLAGETLSWTSAWIQGAMFSGLVQAFCFTYYNESGNIFHPITGIPI